MIKRRKPDTQQDKKIEEDPKQITEEELHRRKQIMEETQTTWEAPQEGKTQVQMEGDSGRLSDGRKEGNNYGTMRVVGHETPGS